MRKPSTLIIILTKTIFLQEEGQDLKQQEFIIITQLFSQIDHL